MSPGHCPLSRPPPLEVHAPRQNKELGSFRWLLVVGGKWCVAPQTTVTLEGLDHGVTVRLEVRCPCIPISGTVSHCDQSRGMIIIIIIIITQPVGPNPHDT